MSIGRRFEERTAVSISGDYVRARIDRVGPRALSLRILRNCERKMRTMETSCARLPFTAP